VTDNPATGYQPGEPAKKLAYYKAEVEAKRMTADAAADAFYAWAQQVHYGVTRQACLNDIRGQAHHP
jgi:hypothetical protein